MSGSIGEIQRANASGWLRESHDNVLTSSDVDRLRRIPSPSVGEQATKLLAFIAKRHPIPGTRLRVPCNPETMGTSWSANQRHFLYLLQDYLADERHFLRLRGRTGDENGYPLLITPAGWAFLDALRAMHADSEYAFVAMSFDRALLPFRREGLLRAVEQAGYLPLIIDEKEFNTDVVDEILADIRRSRFVVADFTQHRNGVYFEAGFAQGLGLEVIRTCRRSDSRELHFDVNHYPFVLWEDDAMSDFVTRLQRRIEALLGHGLIRTW